MKNTLVMSHPTPTTALLYLEAPEGISKAFSKDLREFCDQWVEPDPKHAREGKLHGRPGIPVEVLEVDERRYARWVAHEGARPLTDENRPWIFESTTALNEWIGCGSSNQCAMALSAAKKRGEKEATVRGVRFARVRDVLE